MEQQVLGPDGRSTASRRRASLRSPFHPHSLSRAVEHVAKAQKPRQYNDVASIHWLWPELNRASFATGIYTWGRHPGGDVPTPERRAHHRGDVDFDGSSPASGGCDGDSEMATPRGSNPHFHQRPQMAPRLRRITRIPPDPDVVGRAGGAVS
jgi:hypothetical protein